MQTSSEDVWTTGRGGGLKDSGNSGVGMYAAEQWGFRKPPHGQFVNSWTVGRLMIIIGITDPDLYTIQLN